MNRKGVKIKKSLSWVHTASSKLGNFLRKSFAAHNFAKDFTLRKIFPEFEADFDLKNANSFCAFSNCLERL